MALFHDAPVFTLTRQELLDQFCSRYSIAKTTGAATLITAVATAFASVPYENLTKIIKSDDVIGPQSAMRYPDEVLEDHLRFGTGGTCFSLTAAIIALYDALGIEAHPLLADRHYGTDTHCGLVIIHDNEHFLLDPGYLLFTPVPLPASVAVAVPQGYTTIELCPLADGRRIELATVVKGNRKSRLVYKRNIVDSETFVKAWMASFAWEMMTYPVVTRSVAGRHIYIQGTSVSVRDSERTKRSKVDAAEGVGIVSRDIGISAEISSKAWSIAYGGT